MRKGLLFPLLIAALAGLSGCAGARPDVKFDTSRYPVSLSGTVMDRNGGFLSPEERTTVGRFSSSKKGFAVGYSHANLNKVDFSDEVNRQVAAVNGDAVVNLEVGTTGSCMCFNMVWITQALPIFPGCVKVVVEGDIVRSRFSAGTNKGEKTALTD